MATTSLWLNGVFLLGLLTSVNGQVCDDIDPQACQLMAASRPDLCQDATLSKTACPRFCKKCPLTCYECNTTVSDMNDCNTTMQCAQGQVCMRKELHSYIDGHAEYEMTCESKDHCDGSNVAFHFVGKRDARPRDLSIHCCTDDLCNKPKQTTYACGKDIVFLIDRSISSLYSGEASALQAFIFHTISQLDIGTSDNLVGLTEYDTHPHVKWELNAYTDKYDVLRAVQALDVKTSPNHFQVADTDEALQFIIDHALEPSNGDRPNHQDAVVIVASSGLAGRISVNVKNAKQLQQLSHDVIVVSVGKTDPFAGSTQVATDRNHEFHVASYSDMDDAFIKSILNILKTC